jgi:hypothetical protein
MSRIYSRLAFHQALLDIEEPKVAAAYRLLTSEAKTQAGGQMKTAWQQPVRTTDEEMNLEAYYDRERVDRARDHCVATMRAAHGQGRYPKPPLQLPGQPPVWPESENSEAHGNGMSPAS